jgi:predicted phage terminase large subunit-like protein
MTSEANDFSVCTTWHMIKGDYYLIDVFRARLQYPDLRRKIASLALQHGARTILIENAGPGLTLLQDLHHSPPPGMPHPIGRKPNGSKADRVVAQSAKIEAGHVHLPSEADWLDGFLLELLAFPHGRHDDQVDSVAQFLTWAALREFGGVHTFPMPIIIRGERPESKWDNRSRPESAASPCREALLPHLPPSPQCCRKSSSTHPA